MPSRTTRSQYRQPNPPPTVIDLTATSPEPSHSFFYLSESQLTKIISKLPKQDRQLLLSKQAKLRDPAAQVPTFIKTSSKNSRLAEAAAATLIFAQESAGTAICISPSGLLLTCAHCIAETPEEHSQSVPNWLLFANGDAVEAECVAWDAKRDLALLRIIAAPSSKPFSFARLSPSPPKLGAKILCVGHPGSEDLEANTRGIETGYDVLHISEGRFWGMQPGQDGEDNEEIGAMRHDCWTYWGHSGAPLVEVGEGGLVGLHSSWDAETGMRRGVGWECIRVFLKEGNSEGGGLA